MRKQLWFPDCRRSRTVYWEKLSLRAIFPKVSRPCLRCGKTNSVLPAKIEFFREEEVPVTKKSNEARPLLPASFVLDVINSTTLKVHQPLKLLRRQKEILRQLSQPSLMRTKMEDKKAFQKSQRLLMRKRRI